MYVTILFANKNMDKRPDTEQLFAVHTNIQVGIESTTRYAEANSYVYELCCDELYIWIA